MLAKYGVKWMSGGAKRQCDRALASPRGRPGTCCCTGSALPARAQDTSAPAAKQDAGGIDASRDRPARPQIRARSVRATGHGATGDRAGAGGGAAHVVAQAAHLLDVPDLARGEDLADIATGSEVIFIPPMYIPSVIIYTKQTEGVKMTLPPLATRRGKCCHYALWLAAILSDFLCRTEPGRA
jgi:hypothetical protein